MRFYETVKNLLYLTGMVVLVSCSKGTSTIDKAKERFNYSAKNGKNYEKVAAGYTFSENIDFIVTSYSSVPLT